MYSKMKNKAFLFWMLTQIKSKPKAILKAIFLSGEVKETAEEICCIACARRKHVQAILHIFDQ